MASTRPKRAKPPASSPLSSAPSSPSSASSPPSASSSPYKPAPASRKGPVRTYKSRKAQKKATPAKAEAEPPSSPLPPSSPPPASLDDLLGNMGQDRELKLKRDNSRRKMINLIDSQPSSQTSVAPKPKPKPRKKRKLADEEGNARRAKKRSASLDELEEEEGATPLPEASSATSPAPPSTAAPSSPLSTPRPLAGPSASTLYQSDEEGEETEEDLGAALSRHKVEIKTAEVFDGDLSDPPTPPAPKWKKTVHPGVEPGDTCLVKDTQVWFPAKLLQMTLAETPHDRDFYEVQTQDGKVYHPSRRRIIFLNEYTAIAKVKIGHYKISPASTGVNTPVLLGDDATEHERFRALALSEQIDKLQGHLADLAREAYAPAQWRTDLFYKGKAERASLKEEIAYGDLKDSEIKEANSILSKWVQGHEGTGRFASLAENERSQFASFVLVPEVIIAICIRSLDLDRPSSWARPRDDMPPPEVAADREAARLYALARTKLDELRLYNHALEWEKRRDEVKRTQQTAQKAAGAPAPAPEAGKPLSRRAARLRNPDELSPERQAQLEAAFEREKQKGERAKRKKGKARESTEPASTSAEPGAVNGGEAPEDETLEGEGLMVDVTE